MGSRPDVRCIVCRSEFYSDDIADDVSACPVCGDTGIPADPRDDQTWTIELSDWQSLLSSAGKWEETFKKPVVVPVLSKIILATDITNEHGEHPVRISPHEIRILTFWATRHVHKTPEGSPEEQALERVLKAFHAQAHTPITLTLEEEIEDLRAQGYDAHLEYGKE